VISRRGWEAVAGALAALLLGLFSLNSVVELVAVAAFGFIAGEILVFEWRFRGFGAGKFRASRAEGPRRMPSDGELHTSVEFTYTGSTGFRGEIFDILPDAFDPIDGTPRITTWVGPGDTVRLVYRVRPRVRGAYVTGPTVVIARDAFGFCFRRVSLPTDRAVTVVPPSIAGRLGRLGLALYARIQAGISIRRRGYGSEFRALRQYQPTDDIRHVAWKRSTVEQLMVREFDQESRQDFIVVLDLSVGMDAGLWGRSALDASVEAAALLVNLVARQAEDRVGLLTYAGGVFQYVPPGRGPAHLRRVVDNLALAAHRPGAFPLADVLAQAVTRLRGRSHLFIFSAVDDPLEGLGPSYASLRAHGHQPYLFVPERAGFYPDPPDADRTAAMSWARSEESTRFTRSVAEVRARGIPVFPFDRRGAGDRVLYAYSQIRAWGSVR
jgi:uncharacterized protein (DUF58 family)